MATPRLVFSKDWNNPEDFPPVAANAAQARQNIQLLHDETKTYINGSLLPAVESAVSEAAEALKQVQAVLGGASTGGLITVGAVAPDKTNGLWVDTANGGIIKYYDTTTSAWVACAAVWK